MLIINASTERGALLEIGRQGEHGVTQVWFDLAYLIETYGEGTATLSYMRSKDEQPAPVVTTRDGNLLIWQIEQEDTKYDGIGRCELRWTIGNDLAKTVIYRTIVMKALTGTEPSDTNWYDRVVAYIDGRIADSQQYAAAAEASASDAADSAQDAQEAAGTAATDAANAVRNELSGFAQQASQSATNASNAADRAEDARDEVLEATVTVTPVIADENLTFNAAINGGI